MQHFRYFFLFFLCAFPAFAGVSPDYYQRNVIIIAADNWCPINCAKPESHLGVGIDLAKAIFEPLGYRIDYRIMPWDEALSSVRSGKVHAVIGAGPSDDPRLIFPSQAVYNVTDSFYVQKGVTWRFQGIHTLKGKKLGVIKGYGYGSVVSDYIRSNSGNPALIKVSEGNDALKDNIRKLASRGIDVLVESKPVMEYAINTMRLDGTIEWAGSVPQGPVYLAFSPAIQGTRTLAEQFDAGMRRLQADGKLDAFYQAYGLSSRDR